MSHDATPGMDRRRFLKVVGVTGAGTAALSGCSTDQVQKLIPYLVQSEHQVPGVATIYASTCTECAAGCGLHVTTREARAVKLEGNPEHPVNRGTLCARGQAALQGLYHPDRIRAPMARTAAGGWEEMSWDDALDRMAAQLRLAGGRLAAVSGAGRGAFADLLAEWTVALDGTLVRWEPFDHEALRAASRRVFGRDEIPAVDFARARYILSFGADFLESWLAPVENQRGFAAAHGFADGTMARAVYVGPRRSLTGLNADEWHAVTPGSEAVLALAMAHVILVEGGTVPADAAGLRGALAAHTPEAAAAATGLPAGTIRGLARAFAAAQPGLAVAGGIGAQHRGAVELCAAVHLLNYVAGNVGRTVRFGARLPHGDGFPALEALRQRMAAGDLAVLVVHEANPVYALPRAAGFADAMTRVAFKVALASTMDETAAACDLVLPVHHALERWDDLDVREGVRSLLQPVMQPVSTSRAAGDILLDVARRVAGPLDRFPAPTFEAHLKAVWAGLARARGAADPEEFWREALRRGGLFDEVPARPVTLAPGAGADPVPPAFDGDGAWTLVAYPSPMYFDGRGANRPWLLENPDPVTKITWHSWVEIHPDTARALDVHEGEVLRLSSPHGAIEAPAYLYAGVRPDVVAVPLGLGHTAYGRFAEGRGVNPLDLLSGQDGNGFLPYQSVRVDVTKTRRYVKLAKTEGNPRQLGRHIAEAMPLPLAARGLTVKEAYQAQGGQPHEFNPERELEAIAGWRERQVEAQRRGAYAQEHPKWGLAVDLARCTGCSACVTACYAENNIPWVGEDEVRRGREMSWMRIERYWEGGDDGAPVEARFIPVMCQHCDNAPCEPVCPVYASYQTPDGLNAQVYNRCVGTRYCGNNCPYKVRYFNWYAYAQKAFPEPFNLQLNPEVTVRARGVMEKCTFCIQRIRGAQHTARLEDRAVRDGDIVTACAQACPSGALVFGNVRDPESRVARIMADPRGYHVLEDINVRPAVTYLAKVLHPGEA
jgi:anaerobic selenocysteine-containing dehydrogenase/Fe-S-cluster-containing dehydrogenase component